jgi:hypothetical protein
MNENRWKHKDVVPTWTDDDFRAAVRQGWFVNGLQGHHALFFSVIRHPHQDNWQEIAGGPLPRIVEGVYPGNEEARQIGVAAARAAVRRGEVHAIKAWLHVMTHSTSERTKEDKLTEWELPE